MPISILFILSEILPIILYVYFLKRNKHEGLWVIFIYCLISLVSEPLFAFFRHRLDEFTFFASFTIFEYTAFTLFLFLSFKEKNFRYIPIVGSLIFYTIVIINFSNKKTATFDSLSASVEAILIIIYSIVFLYERIKDSSGTYIYNIKKFWIVLAFFLYFSSTLFLFIYAATFTNQENKDYWGINTIFEIVKNMLFCIAFSMKKGKKSQFPIENLYPDM